ncbi:Dus-domain-containing protein [Metschnikowia bicuspidata var. bicuspidata NRRL YB-4993]|uniref:tRNA-dihydrouridine(16/17) synthase [NAD(P)(+)] n=1 Tax=Metschnikowia bicuspidata var. bicuspidata NRRL YB-4993 TaxID=869754 RepID=A0A1A0HDB9_9ASCO|nr:Dus-domain-containing protein [Metschnikowia bicuspidata var. bicuspidata NRRL YB-4993]OBA21892.1 Dus-domain-containing protein [Metschnikowia bicuspidata var. bicuspidata NRRL YB-4993]
MTVPKLTGRDLFNAIGQPKTIVAPMVDQLELAWRILLRRYGAQLCYTPMFHAKLFATDENYRRKMWSPWDGGDKDRPLIVQFCANDPEYLLQAAQHIETQCDAVDLNLGCPQGIARKGNYGAFLMDDWDLVYKLIRKLHENLKCPVTAKIRVYDDWEKTLEYARMVLSAGAQFITVHGRTREMKGQATGLANWKVLRYLRENLPKDQVFFANGNILYPSDLARCMSEVQCDAVMSAEGNLYNPGVFWTENADNDKVFARVDKMLREYFEIVKSCPGEASRVAMKAHFFKLLHAFLRVHTELRPVIGKTSVHADFEVWESIVEKVEKIVEEIYAKPDIQELDVITESELQPWGGKYKNVPYWRCQPYFRVVNGEKQNARTLKVAASDEVSENTGGKPQQEDEKKRAADDEAGAEAKRAKETEQGV